MMMTDEMQDAIWNHFTYFTLKAMLIHYGVTSPANLSFVYLFFRYVVGGAGDHQCQLGPPGPDVPRHPFGYVAALVSFQFFPLL